MKYMLLLLFLWEGIFFHFSLNKKFKKILGNEMLSYVQTNMFFSPIFWFTKNHNNNKVTLIRRKHFFFLIWQNFQRTEKSSDLHSSALNNPQRRDGSLFPFCFHNSCCLSSYTQFLFFFLARSPCLFSVSVLSKVRSRDRSCLYLLLILHSFVRYLCLKLSN